MAHIPVPENMPGIRGLMAFRPETALPMNLLAEQLLQAPSTLTKGERELIATYVSHQNKCKYCASTHGAIAKHLLGEDAGVVQNVLDNLSEAPIDKKLKALLIIAGQVQIGGKNVTPEAVETARNHGATDIEIHDTVLIAAAFCMFNRYVDGLGTTAPDDQRIYDMIGRTRAETGYLTPPMPITMDA
jgi:uncharacterized peroxidase-related enzyme